MTRTERSASLRAMLKDRSESRSGLDKSIRKNGGGPHNWGRLADEREHEFAALDDEQLEMELEGNDNADVSPARDNKSSVASRPSVSDEELESAKQFRKNALKGDVAVDLAAIARTSAAVSGSPPDRAVNLANDAPTSQSV